MLTVNDCSKGTERALAPLYLAGKLGEDEAAAFEEHYFACASCREDVERGSELRAVFGKAPIVATASPSRSARSWLPLAAAAAIAFAGIGVWQMTRRAAEDPGGSVMRSTLSEVLDVEVAAGPQGTTEVNWRRAPDAASYSVRVVASDDSEVWKGQTRELHLTIGSGALPVPDGGKALFIEVEAFDVMGISVAKSKLIPLPRK